MTLRAILLSGALAAFAWPATPGFETHYLDVGPDRSVIAVAVSPVDGSMFFTTNGAITTGTVVPGRIIKTDANGNTVAELDGISGHAAVDPQGNLLLVSTAVPSHFPTAKQFGPPSAEDYVLVLKIDSKLTQVMASALIGGAATSATASGATNYGLAVATDQQGNVYVTGSTDAVDFPTTPGSYQPSVTGFFPLPTWAFVTKLSPDLSTILYSTYYGGSTYVYQEIPSDATTTGNAVVVDSRGAATVGGSSDGGAFDAAGHQFPVIYGIVARFSPDGSSLEASAQSVDATIVTALALDGAGNTWAASDSGYIARFNSSLALTAGVYTTSAPIVRQLYPSPSSFASPLKGVLVDPQGNVWATGVSDPAYLPGGNPAQPQGTTTPFVAELAGDGSLLSVTPMLIGGAAMAEGAGGSIIVLGSPDSFLLSSPTAQAGPFIVASSANNVSSGTVAPGELVSLYGSGIGPPAALGGVLENGVFSNSVGGYQVLFNDIPAPLFYVGPNQINTVVPEELNFLAATGFTSPTAALKVLGPNGSLNLPTVFVVPSRPQIFGATQNVFDTSLFFATALNQDGTVNAQSNPAVPGSVVTVWATGLGYEDVVDGSIVQQPIGPGPISVNGPVGPLDVLYASDAPGQVLGLTQINFKVSTTNCANCAVFDWGAFGVQMSFFSGALVWVSPH